MTHPRFRRRQRPEFRGDFPDTGETVTEILNRTRPASYDAIVPFTGASSPGQPDGDGQQAAAVRDDMIRAWDAVPPGQLRQAIEQTALADRHRAPAPPPLRALPAPPAPAGQRDTGPQQRLPKMDRIRERPRLARPADAAIFIWSDLLGQHIMKCGVCLRSRHADPVAATLPFTFDELRVSAWQSGWRLDAYARWACPACQGTAAYHAPYKVVHWTGEADWQWAAIGADPAHAGPEFAAWVAQAGLEAAARAAVEQALIADVTEGASHGRHRAVTR